MRVRHFFFCLCLLVVSFSCDAMKQLKTVGISSFTALAMSYVCKNYLPKPELDDLILRVVKIENKIKDLPLTINTFDEEEEIETIKGDAIERLSACEQKIKDLDKRVTGRIDNIVSAVEAHATRINTETLHRKETLKSLEKLNIKMSNKASQGVMLSFGMKLNRQDATIKEFIKMMFDHERRMKTLEVDYKWRKKCEEKMDSKSVNGGEKSQKEKEFKRKHKKTKSLTDTTLEKIEKTLNEQEKQEQEKKEIKNRAKQDLKKIQE